MEYRVDDTLKSILTLDELYVKNIQFERLQANPVKSEGHIQFNIDTQINENTLSIFLTAFIYSEGFFNLKVEIYGSFTMQVKGIEQLIPNAVAIMFPFLRSQVAQITAQPNFEPIVIPTLNINAVLQYNKKL